MEAPVKRAAFVEIYLDVIFVLGIGGIAHLLVAEPTLHQAIVGIALFALIWWTLIGFIVLFNRFGDDTPKERFAFLAATIPGGVAAVAIEPAAHGHGAGLAMALALIRVTLAFAYAMSGPWDEHRSRGATAYGASAVLFLISVVVTGPARYVLWAAAVILENAVILRDLAPGAGGHEHARLDAHHFAERFGLVTIILLAEIVIQSGQGVLAVEDLYAGQWIALASAMLIGAALWWTYFSAAADINREVLELADGSPAVARGLFAVGHMLPAFALLMVSAGVGPMIPNEPLPTGSYWLLSLGLALFLLAARAPAARTRSGRHRSSWLILIVATSQLAWLHDALTPRQFLWLCAAWAVGCAAAAGRASANRGASPPNGAGAPADA